MLIPLPAVPYEMVTRKDATVNFNYHVAFGGAWYSVPFQYVKRTVTVVATARSVSVMCDGRRIAIHERATRKGEYKTNREHMPDAHRDFVEWDGDRFRRWAREVGPSCEAVVDGILRSRKVEQQSYRSCRGVLGLAKAHGDDLLEESCAKALLRTPRPSYKVVKDILAALERQREDADDDGGAYLRGSEYYENLGNGSDDPEEDEE